MNTETLLNVLLYTVAVVVIAWLLFRSWKNMRARQGTGQQGEILLAWARTRGWAIVDTKAKAPWRAPYLESSGTATLTPKQVANGSINGLAGMVASGLAEDNFDGEGHAGTSGNVTYWRFPAPPTDDWLRLRSSQSRFKGQIKETAMESVQFNDEVQVHAHPAKRAYDVLTPDFMDWYLRQSSRPWIHLRSGSLLVVYELQGAAPDMTRQHLEVRNIVDMLQRSGALEKKP